MAGEFLPPVVTRLTGDLGDLAAKIAEAKALIDSLDGKTVLVRVSVKGIAGEVNGAIAQIDRLKAALAGLEGKVVPIGVVGGRAGGGDQGGGGGGGFGGWFGGLLASMGGWKNALHWIIMGSAEILATAIPAVVAFGAAIAGMAQTFVHISDQMSFLRVATGGWRQAMIDSVQPLHSIGMNLGILQNKMAPDAYIIFGSAIQTLSGHFGIFSQMAQQSGRVLSGFALKLSNELSGPLGQQISGFFSGAVKDMTEWGQLLGNLGHIFILIVGDMWGTAKVLLFVLDSISKALLVIIQNPIVGFLIGFGLAMSAVYRYGKLLITVFNGLGKLWVWLGGNALVGAIKGIYGYMSALIALASEEGVVAATTLAFGDLMDVALGPVGLAFAAIGLAVGAYIFLTNRAKDATEQLIARVNKLPNSLAGLTHGFSMLMGGIKPLELGFTKATESAKQYGRYAGGVLLNAQANLSYDTSKLTKAIELQAQKIIALKVGMGETAMRAGAVGGAMKVQAVDTALADSKVQQLNQSIDQYLSLVSSGTGSLATFVQAVNGFGKAMTQNAGAGSKAWQNFSALIGQDSGPVMDFFRQAGVLGAATGKTIGKAALDISASLAKVAGSNKTAQAQVLAFARANGVSAGSFRQLEQEIKKNGAGQKNLAKLVDGTTRAMSNLSQMAQNASNALNTQVSTAIAQSALSATNFNVKLKKLQTDMENHAPASVIQADQRAVQNALRESGRLAIQTGNQVSAGMHAAMRASDQAKATLNSLKSMLESITSHQWTISVGISQHGGITLPGGGYNRITASASGGFTRPGWNLVGELGPELMYLNKGGNKVMPNHLATGRAGAAAIGGGGGDTIVQFFLDGKEIFPTVKRQTLQYNVRNGNRDSGGRPRGVLVPR